MPTKPTPEQTPFEQAVDAAGGLHALAAALGVKPSRAGNWYQRAIPEEFCPLIEARCGIRCEVLRPDRNWTRNTAGTVTGYHTPVLSKVA